MSWAVGGLRAPISSALSPPAAAQFRTKRCRTPVLLRLDATRVIGSLGIL